MLGHEATSTLSVLYDELKVYPWKVIQDISVLRLRGKVINLPEKSLTNKLFIHEKNHLDKSYCALTVKNIMKKIGHLAWYESSTP